MPLIGNGLRMRDSWKSVGLEGLMIDPKWGSCESKQTLSRCEWKTFRRWKEAKGLLLGFVLILAALSSNSECGSIKLSAAFQDLHVLPHPAASHYSRPPSSTSCFPESESFHFTFNRRSATERKLKVCGKPGKGSGHVVAGRGVKNKDRERK